VEWGLFQFGLEIADYGLKAMTSGVGLVPN